MTEEGMIPRIIVDKRGSISTVRALKQINQLLQNIAGENSHEIDMIEASLYDVEVMLKNISST